MSDLDTPALPEKRPEERAEDEAVPEAVASAAEPVPAGSAVPSPVPLPTPTPPVESTGDPTFEVLWAKVVESWDEDKIHAAILEYSVTAERLPDLAGRYRALKDDPAKGERAKKRLDAIILAATSMMMSMRTPANTKIPLPITLSVAGLFACAVAFVAYAMIHR